MDCMINYLPNEMCQRIRIKNESRELMDDLRPDFVFIESAEERNLLYAWFVVELLLCTCQIQTQTQQDKKKGKQVDSLGNVDTAHKCKIINYNYEVLEANVGRKFIISVVSNLDVMHLVRSIRRADNRIEHFISKPIMFWERGFLYIMQLLGNPSQAGYDDQKVFRATIDK